MAPEPYQPLAQEIRPEAELIEISANSVLRNIVLRVRGIIDGNEIGPPCRFLLRWTGVEGLAACAPETFDAEHSYPVQDISLTFFDLRSYADCRPYGYAWLREAFSAGYASRLSWPEQRRGQIDTLIAGRQLRRANRVLEHEADPLADDLSGTPDPAAIVRFFERLEAEFRAGLEGPA